MYGKLKLGPSHDYLISSGVYEYVVSRIDSQADTETLNKTIIQ